jgi:hypothetical protein
VKCCCSVLNAGRRPFLDSSFAGSLGFKREVVGASDLVAILEVEAPDESDLDLRLEERPRPASRAEILVPIDRDSVGALPDLLLEGAPNIDLGLSKTLLEPGASLRSVGPAVVDGFRR